MNGMKDKKGINKTIKNNKINNNNIKKKKIRKDGKQERNEKWLNDFNLTHPICDCRTLCAETEEQVLKIA
jgi:hypothetical protein